MDRDKVKQLRKSLEVALNAVENEMNVKVNIGSARYSKNDCIFKLEIADIQENGEVFNREAADFKMYACTYGLDPYDLGKEFSHGGERFRITGLKTRRHKFPVSAVGVENGKQYKFPVDIVKFALEKEKVLSKD